MAAARDPIERLLAAFARRRPRRAGSLIVTVFGDAILPRGGAVQLAELMTLLAAFKLKEGQVRTALSRLAADGWLAAERRGRRSLYRLTETGRHRFEEATRRIYGGPVREWAGAWHVVILPENDRARATLKSELGWLGFGTLAPGILLHPAPDRRSLASVIGDLPPDEHPLVIAGAAALPASAAQLRNLVARCWDWPALAQAYRGFLGIYGALGDALARGCEPEPLAALVARIMLIHDYRRIILRDPMLPERLLPEDWSGGAAHDLARAIYRRLVPPAEQWIDAHLSGAEGPLPAANAEFRERFG
jgi:phenylacetic acid degradation operon negative regulatory protein